MTGPDRGARLAEVALVVLLFAVLTVVLAYPLSVHPASTVLPAGADTDLNLWLFGWDIHALTHRPWSMFNANIYYPYDHTLAYAENLIGSAALSAPIVWLTGNLVLGLNAAALMSCVLCGVGMYVLARRLGQGMPGAIVAGLIFAFAPPRFFRIGQPHLTAVQWMPFCLASMQAYLDTGDKRHLRWACALFTIQVYTSGHGATLTAVCLLILIVWRVALGESLLVMKRFRDLGLTGALLLALVIPFVLPYRAVQNEMGLRRSMRESFLFAPNAASFIASPSHVDRYLLSLVTDDNVLDTAKALLFPGYLTYLLAAAGILAMRWPFDSGSPPPAPLWTKAGWIVETVLAGSVLVALVATAQGGIRIRYGSVVLFSARQPVRLWIQAGIVAGIRYALTWRAPMDVRGRVRRLGARLVRWAGNLRSDPRSYYLALGVVTFWLALGPGYGLYNRVFDWPGFSFIRVPSRFTIVTLLSLAVLAGFGFEAVTRRLTQSKLAMATAVIALLLVCEFSAFPLTTAPYAVDFPAIDRWLDAQPKPFVVAEVPVTERLQGTYMVHSMAHWQKTIHGYSGMRPDLHSALYDEMTTFPDETSLSSLAKLGVNHIVVHTDYYEPGTWPAIEARLAGFGSWLQLAHIEGSGRVYTLRKPSDSN